MTHSRQHFVRTIVFFFFFDTLNGEGGARRLRLPLDPPLRLHLADLVSVQAS